MDYTAIVTAADFASVLPVLASVGAAVAVVLVAKRGLGFALSAIAGRR